jgi:hypothetical protein
VLTCCGCGEDFMDNPDKVIMTFAEFFTNAHESDLFQQVADEIAREEKAKVVVDPGFRTEEEWAVLTNQVANQRAASGDGGGSNFTSF